MTRPQGIVRSIPAVPSLDDAEYRLRREMTRVVGLWYASGGVLALVALLSLGDRAGSPGGVALVAAASIVFGVIVTLVGERFPLPASVHVLTAALGTAVIGVTVVLGGEPAAVLFGIFYVYVTAFSFYYLSRSWAVAEATLAGIGYAVALAVIDLPGAVGVWVLVMGVSITAGALVGSLGRRQRTLAAELVRSDVARTTLLRIVSHDLRAPLATISGSADTLLQRLPQLSPEVVCDLARAQKRQAEKLLKLVDDVLANERVAAGDLRLDRQHAELRSLVDDVVATFGEHRERVSVTGGPVSAEVDPALLQRAMENLLSNALRHCEGRVRIEIVAGTGHEVEIHVSDDGDGIPQELLGAVFEPFMQAREGGGTAGLGLSLARAIVHAHGGEVTATNQSEGGARFTIALPATDRT